MLTVTTLTGAHAPSATSRAEPAADRGGTSARLARPVGGWLPGSAIRNVLKVIEWFSLACGSSRRFIYSQFLYEKRRESQSRVDRAPKRALDYTSS